MVPPSYLCSHHLNPRSKLHEERDSLHQELLSSPRKGYAIAEEISLFVARVLMFDDDEDVGFGRH